MIKKSLILLCLASAIILPVSSAAPDSAKASTSTKSTKPYSVGDTYVPIQGKDQRGKSYTFKKRTRYVMARFDTTTGQKADKVISKKGKNYLSRHDAIFIADTHKMSDIEQLATAPKMRHSSHRILIADQKNQLVRFPRKEHRVTILRLTPAQKITKITFWDPNTQSVGDAFKSANVTKKK